MIAETRIDVTIDTTSKLCYSVASEVIVIVTIKQNKSISGEYALQKQDSGTGRVLVIKIIINRRM